MSIFKALGPLEKDIREMLTVIVTVRNRQHTLDRAVNYYRNMMPVNVIFLDSSPERYAPMRDDVLGPHNKYLHVPGKIYVEKIRDCLKSIDTKYSIVVCDDDFLSPTGLEFAVSFLEENPDFVAAKGQEAAIWDPELFTTWKGIIGYEVLEFFIEFLLPADVSFTAKERVERAWTYFNGANVHNIIRTDINLKIQEWHLENPSLDAMGWYDKTLTYLLAAFGRIATLPTLHLIRSKEFGTTSLKLRSDAKKEIGDWRPHLKFKEDFLKCDTTPMEELIGVDRKFIEDLHEKLCSGAEKEEEYKRILANHDLAPTEGINLKNYSVLPRLGPGGNLSGEHGWRERYRPYQGSPVELYPALREENVILFDTIIKYIEALPVINKEVLGKAMSYMDEAFKKIDTKDMSEEEKTKIADAALEEFLKNNKESPPRVL